VTFAEDELKLVYLEQRAKRMLAEGTPVEQVQRVTRLSMTWLLAQQERIFGAGKVNYFNVWPKKEVMR